jgi:hypothetical protein
VCRLSSGGGEFERERQRIDSGGWLGGSEAPWTVAIGCRPLIEMQSGRDTPDRVRGGRSARITSQNSTATLSYTRRARAPPSGAPYRPPVDEGFYPGRPSPFLGPFASPKPHMRCLGTKKAQSRQTWTRAFQRDGVRA